MTTLRIATRKSPLAMWQAEHVAASLKAAHPGLAVELVPMSTRGDKMLDAPLAKVGGKGLFVKELERAMLDGRADIAAHSMKDVPAELPEELQLPVVMARETPRDAFVSPRFDRLAALPAGARVGTCSLRRKCQLMALRDDLVLTDLRGNVNTRLAKLDAGEFDALILAGAGLRRLGFAERIAEELSPEVSLPAIGQGAIGIECRRDDPEVEGLIAALGDPVTAQRVGAERAMNRLLGGSCQVPIAGYAEVDGETLWIRGLVGRVDGTEIIRAEARGPADQAAALGEDVARQLLGAGARAILDEVDALA